MKEEEFDRLVSRCRIKLSEPEKAGIRKDIDEVLKYFENIDEIHCDSLPEAYHSVDLDGVTRPDTIEEFADTAGLLKNTKTYRFYVVGPKV